MITQIETAGLRKTDILTGEVSASREPRSLAQHGSGVAQFLAVVVQFGLIVWIVGDWQLESLSLARMMDLAFFGFIIHHLLPQRFRLRFFAILSLVAIVFGLGEVGARMFVGGLAGKVPVGDVLYSLIPGVTLIGIGFGLIGLCHLPVRFGVRVGLVLAAGVGLIWARAHSQWFPDVSGMWAILGSMFMFRLMLYLYDLKHRTAPFSPAHAISYFFLLPNVSFPLFPVIDYKTFCTTYYNEDWPRVYQSGLKWMIRGVIQLLLYRAVYQYAPMDISKLSSALDAAGYMAAMYVVYLRVSGTFHLIVGLLHMFGFNLPETHHLYFLSTSFTDLWRRINIYWKDFVMKLFFYPTHFKFRRLGTLKAISLATVVTFIATWQLHSWQWFWIRGSFPLTWQDTSFWSILALLVLVTALYEATIGRKRTLTPSRITLRRRLVLGLQAAGVFTGMCILWTYWTCQSWAEMETVADAVSRPTLRDIAIICAVLGAICVCGMIWGRSSRETSEGRATHEAIKPFAFWPSATAVIAGAVCLLVAPLVATKTVPSVQYVIARLHSDVLNAHDLAVQRRGYYEELDIGRMDNWQWQKTNIPAGWGKGLKVFYRQRSDFMLTEIAPSVSTILGGGPIKSNRWGMRDREYDKIKPPNTYRMVLLGGSHDQGTGVKEDETYENRVEDRLNRERPDKRYSRYEILNMSVGNTGLFQRLLRLEEAGFQFDPDAVILSVGAGDRQFFSKHLSQTLSRGITPPPGYREILEQVCRKAGIRGKMPELMIERRIQPYIGELYAWAFRRLAQQCKEHGVRPLVIYRPEPVDFEGREASRGEMVRLAREAGIEVIDLSPAFDSVTDRDTLLLAKWDHHTSALGHQLLANKLYEGLVPMLFGAPAQQASTGKTAKPAN